MTASPALLTKDLESAMEKLREAVETYAGSFYNPEFDYKEAAALLAKLEAAERPLLMANGTTTFADYLRNVVPEDLPMDDWTRGYEECKRRLAAILLPQMTAYRAQPTQEKQG